MCKARIVLATRTTVMVLPFSTTYTQRDRLFTFSATGNGYNGHSVTLYTVSDGNLKHAVRYQSRDNSKAYDDEKKKHNGVRK